MTDLDPRNDESRPSLTSGAVAEERPDVSSQNTIYEMADAIIGGNDIGLYRPSGLPINWKKMQEYWLKCEMTFSMTF